MLRPFTLACGYVWLGVLNDIMCWHILACEDFLFQICKFHKSFMSHDYLKQMYVYTDCICYYIALHCVTLIQLSYLMYWGFWVEN